MAEAAEARYLVELRRDLGPVDWLVFKRAEPQRRKTVSAATRLEALMDVAKRSRVGVELLDCEVAR